MLPILLKVSEKFMKFKKWFFESIVQQESGKNNDFDKKEIVVLVGPPAIGKSTYIANKFPKNSVYIVNRDDIVDEVSGSMGLTYDNMFETPPDDAIVGKELPGKEKFGVVLEAPPWMKWAKKVYSNVQEANNLINKKLEERFKAAVNSGKHIIVDMTNMTVGARKSALKYVEGKDYFKRAVVFTLKDSDLPKLIQRMKTRSELIKSQGGSKTIGEDVINRMIKSFQQVSPEEGFDRIDSFYSFTP